MRLIAGLGAVVRWLLVRIGAGEMEVSGGPWCALLRLVVCVVFAGWLPFGVLMVFDWELLRLVVL